MSGDCVERGPAWGAVCNFFVGHSLFWLPPRVSPIHNRPTFSPIPSSNEIVLCLPFLIDGPCSLLAEVVGINLLDLVRPRNGHSNIVINHVLGECCPVYEHDLAFDTRCELQGIRGK